MAARLPIFAKRDLDGFFGLAIDNLVQLLLILTLCGGLCGMAGDGAVYITAVRLFSSKTLVTHYTSTS
jgi:adenine/guanine/hypoxanthine permease